MDVRSVRALDGGAGHHAVLVSPGSIYALVAGLRKKCALCRFEGLRRHCWLATGNPLLLHCDNPRKHVNMQDSFTRMEAAEARSKTPGPERPGRSSLFGHPGTAKRHERRWSYGQSPELAALLEPGSRASTPGINGIIPSGQIVEGIAGDPAFVEPEEANTSTRKVTSSL